jgi:hypothetical protein
MAPRTRLLLVLVALFGLGTALVVDALTLTDKERLEHFVEDFVGNDPEDRVAAALRLADPSREPLELVDRGRRVSFKGGQDAVASHEIHRALEAFTEGKLEVIQTAIELEGAQARVAVRVRTDDGFVNVLFHLNKHREDWLVRRIAVSA